MTLTGSSPGPRRASSSSPLWQTNDECVGDLDQSQKHLDWPELFDRVCGRILRAVVLHMALLEFLTRMRSGDSVQQD